MFVGKHANLTNSSNKQQLVYQATADILPLAIAVIPWGILCGSLAVKVGLSPIQAQLMSLLVFAGAAQLASLTLMGGVGTLTTIFSSTFVISSRHLLYSAVFREHVRHSSILTRCCTAFFLTDEMFAVSCAYFEKNKSFSHLYAITAGVVFYLIWNAATFLGISVGEFIPDLEHMGLEFAIAATFIAIVIPSITNFSILMSVISSGVSVIFFSLINSENALIISTFMGMTVGFFTANKDEKNG